MANLQLLKTKWYTLNGALKQRSQTKLFRNYTDKVYCSLQPHTESIKVGLFVDKPNTHNTNIDMQSITALVLLVLILAFCVFLLLVKSIDYRKTPDEKSP